MNTILEAPLTVEPIKSEIGAVVRVDRETLLDPTFAPRVIELLDKHLALIFPQMNLSDEEQLRFTDNLGDRINFTRTAPGGDYSAQDVYTITLDPEVNSEPEYVYGSMFWHGDGITTPNPPPKYTILSCKVPPEQDGETEFCSTVGAWKKLPESEKLALKDLRVVHTVRAAVRPFMDPEDLNPVRRDLEHEHPLVWSLPDGRKALLVGCHADSVVGMSNGQGRALLARLLEWAGQPDLTIRHAWSEGDLAIWDNTATLHRALPYSDKSQRRMHRTTVAGTEIIS